METGLSTLTTPVAAVASLGTDVPAHAPPAGAGADPVLELQERLGHRFEHIDRARRTAQTRRQHLRELVAGLDTASAGMVVYGSLARGEYTSGSDVDWTLLVDGPADPAHLGIAQDIGRLLRDHKYHEPGPTGVFGSMTFSHDLVNKIGGLEDTNENTTRRILLLLESRAVRDAGAYGRVVRLLLGRYLDDDRGLRYGSAPHKVPRFLVNDIVRYWRMILVDFVDKQRGRAGEGWALRQAKLRLSRKLIFVSGLLTCFACELASPRAAREALGAGEHPTAPMVEYLVELVGQTPLDIVASALMRSTVRPQTQAELFVAYDAFLGILDDGDKRGRLKGLREGDLDRDPVFSEVRGLGRRFQEALTSIFFKEDERLAELTMQYGVF